ncbi:Microcystin-dependent protein [Maribacter sedimenticola]|uniref:Microcystin-dependent protein n=1 Tax=Maribacter sedimenticola TaxID=228956 RepID=A0ABY1SEU7_9FLAO|nr:tail fiber protein [Maribacter sedimenticola]SNR39217.1 Microcystin-dependent protein [Maribacter sedimenticola]
MEPFIGQIMMVGFNFAPRGWALCNGQLLSIASNSALFSLLGTTYGGDGRTTFGLPDLRGRLAVHVGQGPGLQNRAWGQRFGVENNSLTEANLPSHTHTVNLPAKEEANAEVPTGNFIAGAGFDGFGTTSDTTMATLPVSNTGGNVPVTNMQPSLGIYHVIALVGIFPSRS